MTEDDIVYDRGCYWVSREKGSYQVWKTAITHSVGDSAYEKTEDGLSIAIARCDYLADRAKEKAQ